MQHTKAASVSPLYLLERFEVGIVQLDAQRHVVGMNDYARRVLPVEQKQPFDRMVLSFQPQRSQPKVEFMLDQMARLSDGAGQARRARRRVLNQARTR